MVARAACICVALERRYALTRIMTTSNRPPGGFMSNYFLPRPSTRTCSANEDKARTSIRVLETIVRWRTIGGGECATWRTITVT